MAKFTFDDLEKKYAHFTFPCFSLKINENEIDEAFCRGDILVELMSGFGASCCFFDVYNGFEEKSETSIQIKSDLAKIMKLGNKVEVLLGYKDCKMVSVFKGYIDSLFVDYNKDTGIMYRAECLDGKGIMMNTIRSLVHVGVKKKSEAIEQVLKKYTSVLAVSSSNLDKTDTGLERTIEQHNESDYQFVARLCKELGYCFYVELGSVICKPYGKLSKESVIEFHINEYMEGFQLNASIKEMPSSVVVRSNNEKDETKPFEGKATEYESIVDSSKTKTNITSLITSSVTKTFIDPSISSEKEAIKLAQTKLNAYSKDLYEGRVKTVGIPDILPGTIAELAGFGSDIDGKFFISKVTHKIYNNRYTTQCELEVNKL